MDAISAREGASEMLIEKFQRPRHGFLRCLFVVAGAHIAIESMPCVIPIDLDFRMGLMHLGDLGRRNMIVLFPEMKHDWNARIFLSEVSNVATVIAHSGGGPQPGRAQPGQRSSITVANHSGWFPRLFGGILQGSIDILHCVVDPDL